MSESTIYSAVENYFAYPRVHASLSDRLNHDINTYASELEAHGRLSRVVMAMFSQASNTLCNNDAIFYLAGALTEATEAQKQRYANVSADITAISGTSDDVHLYGYAPHINGTDPVKHPTVTPREVRDIDCLWAKVAADCHINFWDPMAHGNAIEAGWAEAAHIPSLYVTPAGKRLSRLVLGMHNIIGIVEYEDFDIDGRGQVRDFLMGVRDGMRTRLQQTGDRHHIQNSVSIERPRNTNRNYYRIYHFGDSFMELENWTITAAKGLEPSGPSITQSPVLDINDINYGE